MKGTARVFFDDGTHVDTMNFEGKDLADVYRKMMDDEDEILIKAKQMKREHHEVLVKDLKLRKKRGENVEIPEKFEIPKIVDTRFVKQV